MAKPIELADKYSFANPLPSPFGGPDVVANCQYCAVWNNHILPEPTIIFYKLLVDGDYVELYRNHFGVTEVVYLRGHIAWVMKKQNNKVIKIYLTQQPIRIETLDMLDAESAWITFLGEELYYSWVDDGVFYICSTNGQRIKLKFPLIAHVFYKPIMLCNVMGLQYGLVEHQLHRPYVLYLFNADGDQIRQIVVTDGYIDSFNDVTIQRITATHAHIIDPTGDMPNKVFNFQFSYQLYSHGRFMYDFSVLCTSGMMMTILLLNIMILTKRVLNNNLF